MKKLAFIIAIASLAAACSKTGSPSKSSGTMAGAVGTSPTGLVPPPTNGGFNAGGPPPPPSTAHDKIVTSDAVVTGEPGPEPRGRTSSTTPPIADVDPLVAPSTTDKKVEHKELPHLADGQCGEAYRENSGEWFPGLPTPPSATPVFTDLEGRTGTLRFTDARQDGLFNVAVDRANAMPKEVLAANQNFAKQIRDVKVSIDSAHTREVKVRVVYMHEMRRTAVELRGVMEKASSVQLAAVPAPGAPQTPQNFAGVLTCADAENGCKSVLLRLDLKAQSGKVVRSAYIVHRWSSAHITMSDADRRQFARIPNQNQSVFAEYLSNTVNNSCLNVLAQAQTGKRSLPQCAIERLQASCGGEEVKKPAARDFGLRSWAVAYGKSGFEFMATSSHVYDGVADYDMKRNPYVVVSGPLAYGKGVQAYSHPLLVTGAAKGVNEVHLMNNDGAGNINLEFNFTGQSDSRSRVSVSSMLPSQAYADAVVSNAKAMPSLSQQDLDLQNLDTASSDEAVAQ